MSYAFPTMPPPHICLIACVDHPLDPAPRNAAPSNALIPMSGAERHWAQHNLSYVSPGLNGIIDFSFMAGNPFQLEAEFIFEVRPFARERLDCLRHSLRAELVNTEARCEILAVRDLRNALAPGRARHPYTLDAGRPSAMHHLRMRLSKMPQTGQLAVFEILQRRAGEDRPVGGIALVVGAPEKGCR